MKGRPRLLSAIAALMKVRSGSAPLQRSGGEAAPSIPTGAWQTFLLRQRLDSKSSSPRNSPTPWSQTFSSAFANPPLSQNSTAQMPSSTSRYAFSYPGGVTTDARILKALVNDGPLIVEQDSLIAELLPDALKDNGSKKELTQAQEAAQVRCR